MFKKIKSAYKLGEKAVKAGSAIASESLDSTYDENKKLLKNAVMDALSKINSSKEAFLNIIINNK